MFIRWRRKKSEKEGLDLHYLRAELVECNRIDGKPRQKTVKYLGSIREDWTTDKPYGNDELVEAIRRGSPGRTVDEIRNALTARDALENEKHRIKFWNTINSNFETLQSERDGFIQDDAEAIKAKIGERVNRVVWAETKEGKNIYL
jgi:hypothetical protein